MTGRLPRSVMWLVGLALSMLLPGCVSQTTATLPPPTVIVVTSVGPFRETFDSQGEWLLGESEISSGRIADGKYVLSVTKSHQLAWTHVRRTFADGIYAVEAQLLSGPEASAFGMIFLVSEDAADFLYFEITGDGRYDVGYCQDSCATQVSLIGDFKLGYTILPAGETNHLRVEINNGSLFFQVNGAPISELHRVEYQPGAVGLLAESSPRGGMEVVFDNFQVTETSATPEASP